MRNWGKVFLLCWSRPTEYTLLLVFIVHFSDISSDVKMYVWASWNILKRAFSLSAAQSYLLLSCTYKIVQHTRSIYHVYEDEITYYNPFTILWMTYFLRYGWTNTHDVITNLQKEHWNHCHEQEWNYGLKEKTWALCCGLLYALTHQYKGRLLWISIYWITQIGVPRHSENVYDIM